MARQITHFVQKQLEPEEEEEILQAKEARGEIPEVTPNIEVRINTLRASGQPLPEQVRAFFEQRFGYDFSRVRVHTDRDSGEMSKRLNAQAFTHERDIYFGVGKYRPSTSSGKTLLAHELMHVIQQDGSNSGRSEGLRLFRFVSQERTQIGNLDEVVDTARRVADDTGMVGLMRWGRFTAAMGGAGAIEALISPERGSTARTPFPRYLYTCRCGLIDLAHFYQLMYIATLRSEKVAVKRGLEHEKTAETESAFAPEDIISNALGAEFGSQRSWVQRQSTFISALRTFLSRCEPVTWHRSLITPAQRECVINYYDVQAAGGSHRRRTVSTDTDPCNVCSGRTDFPFRTDQESGSRIL